MTQDLGVVSELFYRVIVMYAGRIVEGANGKEICNTPKHQYTKELIDSVHNIGDNQRKLYSIPGTVPNPSHLPQGCKFARRCAQAMDICFKKEPELFALDGRHSRCWLHDQTLEKGGDKT